MLQTGGRATATALLFTEDGRGKVVMWGHKRSYSVMWLSASGIWWFYKRRIEDRDDAVDVLYSREFRDWRSSHE